MRDRYTIKDARRVFAELCEAYGKVNGFYTESKGPDGRTIFTANIGAWHLDENFVYGGVVVCEIVNAGGGESCPLGYTRRTSREFCEWARALIYGRRSAVS